MVSAQRSRCNQSHHKINIQTCFSQFLWFFSLKFWCKGQIISIINLILPNAYKLMCFDRNIYGNSDVKFLECDYLLEQQWSITYFSTGWDNQTPKSPLLQKHLKIMKARYPCLIVHISKGMINCYVYVIKLVWKSSSTKCLEAERRQQLVFGYRPKFEHETYISVKL